LLIWYASVMEAIEGKLAAKFGVLFPHLDERQRRLLMGAEARALGHGGIRLVARAAGVREGTVSLGVSELDSGEPPLGRVRRAGAGRKRVADVDPGLRPALLALVEPDMRGDPTSPLRWTTKSTRVLAGELTRQGHRISADTVGDLLRDEGFSLQSNAKVVEGKQHPDRDAQFRYLNEQVRAYRDVGDPAISVDTKKKELIGLYKNDGREWTRSGEPVPVKTHDFPDAQLGKAIPYGIYDVSANTGWVSVGTDHDTSAFAVASIRRWWNSQGKALYPSAGRLLITADAGGSNSYRTRAWKTELAAFAAQSGLVITVCHFPPGTSKWNTIEHRLFCHITLNWRGRPLISHEVIVNTIAATTTRTGLRVHAELDTDSYATGTVISDAQLADVPLTHHDWHGDWNYTVHPQRLHPADELTQIPAAAQPDRPDHTWLYHPALTGLPPAQWDELIAELSILHHAQQEALMHARRGGPRHRPAGTGRRTILTLPDRALATILHSRFRMPSRLSAALLGVSYETINKAVRLTRPLLTLAGYTPEPTTTRIRTHEALTTFASTAGINPTTPEIKPAC
jgi:hypothetical protein